MSTGNLSFFVCNKIFLICYLIKQIPCFWVTFTQQNPKCVQQFLTSLYNSDCKTSLNYLVAAVTQCIQVQMQSTKSSHVYSELSLTCVSIHISIRACFMKPLRLCLNSFTDCDPCLFELPTERYVERN